VRGEKVTYIQKMQQNQRLKNECVYACHKRYLLHVNGNAKKVVLLLNCTQYPMPKQGRTQEVCLKWSSTRYASGEGASPSYLSHPSVARDNPNIAVSLAGREHSYVTSQNYRTPVRWRHSGLSGALESEILAQGVKTVNGRPYLQIICWMTSLL